MVKTDFAFKKIEDSASAMVCLVDEITEASLAQAHRINRMNQSMIEMDKVTRRLSTHAEESARTSEELTGQTRQLERMVEALNTLTGAGDVSRKTMVGRREKSILPAMTDTKLLR